jgi:hypothetical protein
MKLRKSGKNYNDHHINHIRKHELRMKIVTLIIWMVFATTLSAQTDPDVENYNYVLGTQTIGPKYMFTSDDALVETAKEIYNMGSRILKISLNLSSYGLSGSYSDVTSIVRDQASFKYVLDMPFRDYFFWARSNANWADGYSESERSTDSVQLYDLTKYLLTQYNNTGKTFYLGHWEGDWYLLPNYDRNYVPSDERCQNMAKWYRTRQNAVDKAKEDTDFLDVNVFHYAEINQVVDAKDHGKKRVVNSVLPLTNVDYVSYSAYDAQWFDQNRYNSILNYIESYLPYKAGFTGKRVFVGEVGNSLEKSGWDINKHESDNRNYFLKSMRWGCPFVLYWQMYNNEINSTNNQHRGFWLIDNNNQKQPLYDTFYWFYDAAKKWVAQQKTQNGSLPAQTAYLQWAALFLQQVPTVTETLNDDANGSLKYSVFENRVRLKVDYDCNIRVFNIQGILFYDFLLHANEPVEINMMPGTYIVSAKNRHFSSTVKIIL